MAARRALLLVLAAALVACAAGECTGSWIRPCRGCTRRCQRSSGASGQAHFSAADALLSSSLWAAASPWSLQRSCQTALRTRSRPSSCQACRLDAACCVVPRSFRLPPRLVCLGRQRRYLQRGGAEALRSGRLLFVDGGKALRERRASRRRMAAAHRLQPALTAPQPRHPAPQYRCHPTLTHLPHRPCSTKRPPRWRRLALCSTVLSHSPT